MKQSDLGSKIANLEEQFSKIKTSQILSGTNTEVYHRYIEFQSPSVRFGGGQAFSNWYWFDLDGGGYSGVRMAIGAENDNPFELLEIEKAEVWRNDKLITGWSSFVNPSNRGWGQKSSLGDIISIEMMTAYSVFQTGALVNSLNRIGPFIIVKMEGGPSGSFTDNPATPFKYTFKLWIKTTNPSEYKVLGSSG